MQKLFFLLKKAKEIRKTRKKKTAFYTRVLPSFFIKKRKEKQKSKKQEKETEKS